MTISRSDAIDRLWRSGVLHWKLDSAQQQLYSKFKTSKYRKVVWNCARRLGKSYTLLIVALEYALQNPNTQIKYAVFTAVQGQKIILPTIRMILEDCPADIKPNYVKNDKCFYFPNGSIIQIEGTDEGNAEKLRGTASHLSILDEAGFMDDLDYVINDILLPQALTTNGRMLIASTPSKSPSHPFTGLVMEAQKYDSYIKKTILDAVVDIQNDPPHLKNRLNPDIIEELKQASGGENSTTWRREYMCEIVLDSSMAVVPEFNEAVEKVSVVEWPRPVKFDSYTSLDLGFVDYTAALFAYLDFRSNKLVIEDELWMNGQEVTTKNLAEQVKATEARLWTDPKTQVEQPVYLRVSDDDLLTLNDLYRQHGLTFIPTRKDKKEDAINEVRMRIGSGDIIINPRCKNLIYQLKTGTWAKNRKTFDRSPQAGHYDLLDALIYLVRNVQWHKNPYPITGSGRAFDVFDKGSEYLSNTASTIKNIFKVKK